MLLIYIYNISSQIQNIYLYGNVYNKLPVVRYDLSTLELNNEKPGTIIAGSVRERNKGGGPPFLELRANPVCAATAAAAAL